jgi:hypothetical protein
MRSWITTVGPSPFALINTFWAAVERDKWVSERIFLIYNEQTQSLLPGISQALTRIVKENGSRAPEIRCKLINEDDLGNVFKTYQKVINDERDLGNKIAIDITPGRKYMSAFSLYAALKEGSIDKIYYIHIRGKKFMNQPYPMIPVPYCDLEDIVSIGGVKE